MASEKPSGEDKDAESSGPFCYKFPRPAVTVDLVLFAREYGQLRVLLIRRKHDPFAGQWAIPGGFVEMDEPIETAARRELKEETGIDLTGPITMLNVYGDPGRDPRGRTISLVYVASLEAAGPLPTAGDDAGEACWIDPDKPLGLAFDHAQILADARRWLAEQG